MAAAKRVIKSGWVAQGKEVDSFEAELASFFELSKDNVVVVSSGTAALYLALWALKSNDTYVGVPVYSCSSLRNAVEMVGAKAIFLDCGKKSPNIDLVKLKSSDIQILIASSMFGIPIEIPKTRYKVIEDLAQAFGAMESGRHIGLRGALGVCSFSATKLITSGGQGGAIISKDKSLIDTIRDYCNFNNRRDSKIRFNFQMTDIQAAIGREQLKQFSDFKKRRENIFESYLECGLDMLDSNSIKSNPVRYRAILKTKNPVKIIDELNKIGVQSIIPIEQNELLSDSSKYINANFLTKNTVSLPVYPSMNLSFVKKISKCILRFSRA